MTDIHPLRVPSAETGILSIGAGTGTRFFMNTTKTNAKKDGARRTMFFLKPAKTALFGDTSGPKKYVKTGSYLGEWRSDSREGFGKQEYSDGSCYEGYWLNNKPHGRGVVLVLRSATGTAKGPKSLKTEYEGEFVEGKRHGNGKLYFANGDLYDGAFQNGKRCGQGKQIHAEDGTTYTGEWLNDMMHGQGILSLPNGDRYEGSFENNLKHGAGTLIFSSKRMVLEGEWVNGASICGEMRQILDNDDPAAIQAAGVGSAPDVLLRGSFPPLQLAEPYSVLRDAARQARLSGGGGGQQSNNNSVSDADLEAATSLSAHLGLSTEELQHLIIAFRAGEAQAIDVSTTTKPLHQVLLPTDPRIAMVMLLSLNIVPGESDLLGLLQQLNNGSNRFSFEVFSSVMSSLRSFE
jgi:hypothetical protein